MLFKLLFIRFEKKVCLTLASFYIECMKAVVIDAIVNFEFRLPSRPLSLSALSFHTLNCC